MSSFAQMGRRKGVVDPTNPRQVHMCRGSYTIQRAGAMDPITQWAAGKVPWILLPSGPANACGIGCIWDGKFRIYGYTHRKEIYITEDIQTLCVLDPTLGYCLILNL